MNGHLTSKLVKNTLYPWILANNLDKRACIKNEQHVIEEFRKELIFKSILVVFINSNAYLVRENLLVLM